jgi:hypothetical protein
MTEGRATGSIGRAAAGPALWACVAALGCAVGVASPAGALPPVRIALADGLRHVEIGSAEAVTVLDPAGGALFSLTGPRILRVVPSGAGLDVVGARRADLRALRFEARRGPLRFGPRDFVGALEISRRPRGSS